MPVLTDWTIPVTAVPEGGMRFTRTGTENERRALADALEILEVTALTCDLRIRPLRQGRYQMAGTVKADVVQACVVSLEPVKGSVEETIDLEFWPEGQIPGPPSTAQDEWFDPQAPDGAEPIEHGRIAAGRLVFETLSAALDPYPRKPGATLSYQEEPDMKAQVHPFAALAKLKQPKS